MIIGVAMIKNVALHSSLNSPAPSAPRVAIMGGGPAGLMAAEVISAAGIAVDIFDAMPSLGRKFLLAGVGGMNITHSEPFAPFMQRYGAACEWLTPILHAFDNNALRAWVRGLGVETFVGSSGRVFPQDMKAAPLLRAWLQRLREQGVRMHPRHRWLGWRDDGALHIQHQGEDIFIQPSACVLALGGASWQRLGSDGAWVPWLRARHVAVNDMQPSNCGFVCEWSAALRAQHAGAPLHTCGFSLANNTQVQPLRGEAIITDYGIEGSAIYALSAWLRTELLQQGRAELLLDLLPDTPLAKVQQLLQQPRGKNSQSNFLRKQLKLSSLKIALLRELTAQAVWQHPAQLAQAIKALPLPLTSMRPIDEAISCAGGVTREALSEQLMLKALPGVFCAGEMLDWEAPTGGYLLTACFATGRRAGWGVVNYLAAHTATGEPQ